MDSNSLQIATEVIGNFGFPLVLAVYLLLRFEKKIEFLTDAITTLKETIAIKNSKENDKST
ncbi:YvrJ family protein [Heyndrickxia ginsengihumi]|nr:YvrJ family protein [Heyndrickxia ginsengihumi]MCM3024983.1 YvrJ family protein [Heyndrickxia ginsengihumi]